MSREEVLWTIVCGLASMGVGILAFMSVQLWNLNEKIAIILTNYDWHNRILTDHEDRISYLELKR